MSGKWLKAVAGVLVSGVVWAGVAKAQTVTPVPQLDLTRMVGTWYEVLRLPLKADKKCLQQSTVLYALGDKPSTFTVVQTCPLAGGFKDVKNFDGKRQKKGATDGSLAIKKLVILSNKFDVIALGPDYQWAVLGTRNHKLYSVLSRTPVLAEDALGESKSRLSAEGFNVSKLISPPPTK
jgi:apolipoprotein D and lipocalin family protein